MRTRCNSMRAIAWSALTSILASMRRAQSRAASYVTPRYSRLFSRVFAHAASATLLLLIVIGTLPAATSGVLELGAVTRPRGLVWINGSLGGHLWVTDAVLGVCRVDNPLPATLTNCVSTLTDAGQMMVGDVPPTGALSTVTGLPLPPGAKYVYVATRSGNGLERVPFDPATETLFHPEQMIPLSSPIANLGPVALALGPNHDLFVGYLDSPFISQVRNIDGDPRTQTLVNRFQTSHGTGVNSLLMFGNDLYIAERGGFGLSKGEDPDAVSGSTPCVPGSVPTCSAVLVAPQVSVFPGGLATDGTVIYIGDAPPTSPNSILRYNPSSGAVDTYSSFVPSYTSQFDGVTRNTYFNPFGLGLAPNGDLYVGDDPTFELTVSVSNQGHVWRIPSTPAPGAPTVTSISPANGPSIGGTVVTISGSNLAGGFVTFGVNAATSVSCSTDGTTCTVTSPAGTGTVDILVTNALALTSAPTTADRFTYIADTTPPTAIPTQSPAPNPAGWNSTDVTVFWNWTDNAGGSGIDAAHCTTSTTSAGEGTITLHATCNDLSGNTGSASYTVKVDKTKPTLNPTVSPNPVALNGVAVVQANATDAGSGIASQSCGAADTSTLGTKSATCTATDNAGNSNSAAAMYSVTYAAAGLCLAEPGHQILQPVNADGTSVFKKGSTVPAKFRVCDASGTSIGSPGVVAGFALVKTFAGTVVNNVNETVLSTSADTAFRFDSVAQQWIFNIGTKPLTAGVTYFYRITLNDGSLIDFSFGLR